MTTGVDMVPEVLPVGHETSLVRADGRPLPGFRNDLRRIPNARNALSVVGLFAQTGLVVYAAVRWAPWAVVPAFILMGRAHAQFASLMHEAAHRLLFSNLPRRPRLPPSKRSTSCRRRLRN